MMIDSFLVSSDQLVERKIACLWSTEFAKKFEFVQSSCLLPLDDN